MLRRDFKPVACSKKAITIEYYDASIVIFTPPLLAYTKCYNCDASVEYWACLAVAVNMVSLCLAASCKFLRIKSAT